jgi:hypothetical protein
MDGVPANLIRGKGDRIGLGDQITVAQVEDAASRPIPGPTTIRRSG